MSDDERQLLKYFAPDLKIAKKSEELKILAEQQNKTEGDRKVTLEFYQEICGNEKIAKVVQKVLGEGLKPTDPKNGVLDIVEEITNEEMLEAINFVIRWNLLMLQDKKAPAVRQNILQRLIMLSHMRDGIQSIM
ncbi:MAG: hypothetical protein ACMG6E_08655 [Candidatus Roizmanbacteria bacterium]